MATGKARKKDKLRHAEYYDFQEIQDKLYADSSKGKVFKYLVEIIVLPENIRLAYRNIKKNHGSMTPGTDGKTITDLATLSDEQLISSVQHKLGWYVPQSVRRVEIPKGNDPTKKRPLGIPTIMDSAYCRSWSRYVRLNSTTTATGSALTGTNSTQSPRFIRICREAISIMS